MGLEKDFKSDLIRHSVFKDGIISGEVNFPALKKTIVVEVDPELGNPNLNDFNQLADKLRSFIAHFTAEIYDELILGIAEEIANNIFEQEGYEAGADDYKILKKNLSLEALTVFPEGFALKYMTEKFFPDYYLMVELANDYQIEDLALYD